jgi:hypothetical protein
VDDGNAPADDAVEQRGLADIGPADDGNQI